MSINRITARILYSTIFVLSAITLRSQQNDPSLESLQAMQKGEMDTKYATDLSSAKQRVKQDPTNGNAWFFLGTAYQNLGDFQSAKEAFQSALTAYMKEPPDWDAIVRLGPDRPMQSHLLSIANTDVSLATVCEKLHKKREASHYTNSALRIFAAVQAMPSPAATRPLSAAHPTSQSAQRKVTESTSTRDSPSLNAGSSCPLAIHEVCQMPPFTPQAYDPTNPQPYKGPDTRDYDRCVVENQREDARYQQCLRQSRDER